MALPKARSLREFDKFVEDENMKITGVAAALQRGGFGRTTLTGDVSNRPMVVNKGGKFEAYFSDDPSDSVSIVSLSVDFLFIPPTING